MDRIWAPWRMAYIRDIDNQQSEDAKRGCIFCWKPADPPGKDGANLIVDRREHCFTILNLFPYNNSHLMVVPYRHSCDLCELEDGELLDCQRGIQEAIAVMKATLQPQGFNVGLNMGKAAGAGIDQHLHWHVVPRWVGDTNFLPVIGGTKIVSESIEDSYQRLLEGFAARRKR